MYCKKCGKPMEDGAVFCRYCGTHQGMEEKKAAPGRNACPNCGAVLAYDENAGRYECAYCGYNAQSHESDAVRLERMRQEARAKEAEDAFSRQEQVRAAAEKNRRYQMYRHEKMRFWIIIFMIIWVLYFISSFQYAGFIQLFALFLQMACYVLYFLLGSQYIPEKRENFHRLFGTIGLLMNLLILLMR